MAKDVDTIDILHMSEKNDFSNLVKTACGVVVDWSDAVPPSLFESGVWIKDVEIINKQREKEGKVKIRWCTECKESLKGRMWELEEAL